MLTVNTAPFGVQAIGAFTMQWSDAPRMGRLEVDFDNPSPLPA